jgi:hypothetical protein
MGLATAIIGSAIIGGAVATNAANQNRKAAEKAAATNAATIKETKTENTALLKPYSERGNAAGERLNAFLGLSGSQEQDRAFQRYQDSTGYQFQLKSGADAINSNLATKGLLKSGSALKSLTKYGQNVGNTYAQNYLGNLQTQQGVGLSAAGQNAATNSNAAGMSVNNQNALTGQQIQSNTDNGNALTNLLGNAVSAYGFTKGQSSYGSSSKPKTTGTPGIYGPY